MDIRVPEVGESVREALVAKWFRKNGDTVAKDEPLCEIETDKITLDLSADAAGTLAISVAEGTTVAVGTVIGSIEERAASAPAPTEAPAEKALSVPDEEKIRATVSSPAARREMREQGIAPDSVAGTGKRGRITLDDLLAGIEAKSRRLPEERPVESVFGAQQVPPPVTEPQPPVPSPVEPAGQPVSVRSEEAPRYTADREERRPLSPIRRRIAERLVAARQQTAMLTTFNEADLGRVKALRDTHREHFQKRHGIDLGYMPFFVKACVEALREFPAVNASIDGGDVVYHHYFDIGIAIGGDKGLVVPVLRDADRLRLFEIERTIRELVDKVKTNRLAIADLEGGTFTISNGGVYGSMLSTPILNPPQSGVLGMHAIQDRPVARDGQILIRPMMYLALSYDHRIIDGREAVGFLRRVKACIEEPEELLLEG